LEELKSESMAIQERLERKFIISYISAKPFCCSYKRTLSILWSQTNASELEYRMHSVFCVFILNFNIVVSFHHAMAMKCRLEDDEIEKQLKCKKCDADILRCLEEYHKKART
jgi:hypothetical protein